MDGSFSFVVNSLLSVRREHQELTGGAIVMQSKISLNKAGLGLLLEKEDQRGATAGTFGRKNLVQSR
jgi:hypothetical protein